MSDFNWKPVGLELAYKILNKSEGKLLVYFDPDVDGLFSGYLACRVLDALGKSYDKYINSNRAHGFLMSEQEIAALAGRTVIAVDFSISEDKLALLYKYNVRLINIDHHDIRDKNLVYWGTVDNPDGVVINNQYCFEPDEHRYLSGAGCVFYTFANMFEWFDTPLTRALVGITLLSDIRPIENDFAKIFLSACYTSRDPYMLYLVKVTKADRDFSFGVPLMERNYIDFTFSPKINALFRMNRGYDAIGLLFGSASDLDLDAIRQEQNAIRDDILGRLSPVYTSSSFDLLFSPEFDVSPDFAITNFIGLTCSKIKGDSGKSTITYMGTGSYIKRGSFRGRYDNVDYLSLFQRYGFSCAGHANAFGISDCNISNIDISALDSELKALEQQASLVQMKNRLIPVDNMSLFIHTDLLKQVAMSNNYVRDQNRIYLKYTGTAISHVKHGKMIEYTLDNIKVKCFDEALSPTSDYILPIYDRRALSFYLKPAQT